MTGHGHAVNVDVAIVGGGVAGLWLANRLSTEGYGVLVLEADRLGGMQTLASQGMIHGGLKYALAGSLSGASEAIAAMPARWGRCLEGRGDVDLSGLEPLSDAYYMFAGDRAIGRLTTFFASRALRGRIRRVVRAEYPPVLADPAFRGVVYRLDDFVLDPVALVTRLHARVADRVYRTAVHGDALARGAGGVSLHLAGQCVQAERLIVSAGAGTQALLDALGVDAPRMQLRPLHQVVARHPDLAPLYAHCLTGIRRAEPRLTITAHRDGDAWLWYLGGQLASDGVTMTRDALVRHARRELEVCLPWVDWRAAELSTLRIERAEPVQPDGRRPDQAFAADAGPCIVAWPTKLSLVPDLGDRVLALLPPPRGATAPALDLPPAEVGRPPWQRHA